MLLENKKFLVTAGPTYELIDPVRFIGNFSTGKMGFALANELAKKNVFVTLVVGPVSLSCDHPNIHRIDVVSADDMLKACMDIYPNMDGAILTAAVADYKPKTKASSKIKSGNTSLTLDLVPTPNIARELGKIKTINQLLIGFALETQNELENAHKKMLEKNFDFIVMNSLNDKGAGFISDTNKITILDKQNNILTFELKTKPEVAKDIIRKIESL